MITLSVKTIFWLKGLKKLTIKEVFKLFFNVKNKFPDIRILDICILMHIIIHIIRNM